MAWSYWNQPKYVMLLPLEGGKEAVLKKIDGKDRYKIRYAVTRGVTVDRVSVNESTVADLHRVMSLTARKKGIFVHDPSWYEHFLRVFGGAGFAALFLARRGDQTVSAGVSMRMGTRAWLMYLGSDYSAPKSSWALQWDMVAWAIEQGCLCYDFRGAATNYPPSPTDKGYGVYRFKKSFGARLEPMAGYFDLVLGPGRYRLFRWAEQRLLPMAERLLDLRARWGTPRERGD
jgi:lipid II:glycine glycyltransferase (peptidoglycan interpeptide bridge formation enzyme)